MAEYLIQDTTLDAIADAINAKTGGSSAMTPAQMVTEIGNIPSGGGDPNENLVKANNDTLTSFSDDTITQIKQHMFYNNTALETVSCANVTKINALAFFHSGITGEINDTNFPSLNYLGQRCFRGSSKITGLIKPSTHMKLGGICFESCSSLKTVDVLSFAYVEGDQYLLFQQCTSFDTLIIRRTDSVNSLGSIAFFNTTPFRNGTGGTLYVPQSLVASYQAATNWSTLLSETNNQILPIEGSIYEI